MSQLQQQHPSNPGAHHSVSTESEPQTPAGADGADSPQPYLGQGTPPRAREVQRAFSTSSSSGADSVGSDRGTELGGLRLSSADAMQQAAPEQHEDGDEAPQPFGATRWCRNSLWELRHLVHWNDQRLPLADPPLASFDAVNRSRARTVFVLNLLSFIALYCVPVTHHNPPPAVDDNPGSGLAEAQGGAAGQPPEQRTGNASLQADLHSHPHAGPASLAQSHVQQAGDALSNQILALSTAITDLEDVIVGWDQAATAARERAVVFLRQAENAAKCRLQGVGGSADPADIWDRREAAAQTNAQEARLEAQKHDHSKETAQAELAEYVRQREELVRQQLHQPQPAHLAVQQHDPQQEMELGGSREGQLPTGFGPWAAIVFPLSHRESGNAVIDDLDLVAVFRQRYACLPVTSPNACKHRRQPLSRALSKVEKCFMPCYGGAGYVTVFLGRAKLGGAKSKVGNVTESVHRLVATLADGFFKHDRAMNRDANVVCHACHMTNCACSGHLFWGTSGINIEMSRGDREWTPMTRGAPPPDSGDDDSDDGDDVRASRPRTRSGSVRRAGLRSVARQLPMHGA